jgi:hypothetical protein
MISRRKLNDILPTTVKGRHKITGNRGKTETIHDVGLTRPVQKNHHRVWLNTLSETAFVSPEIQIDISFVAETFTIPLECSMSFSIHQFRKI